MPGNKGFTIIELIVVIVLMGIAGAMIIPRFLEPSAFEIASAQDGLISAIRTAQQAALGRDEISGTVTFEIETGSDGLQLSVKSEGNLVRSLEIPANDLVLETGSAAASGNTCATGFDTAVTAASGFQLTFDKQGNLSQFSSAGIPLETVDPSFNGVRLCVNDTDSLSVCVSRAGYAYAGNCDD